MSLKFGIELRNGSRGQDRAAHFVSAFGDVLLLADGAGGFGDGAVAADLAVSCAARLAADPAMSLERALRQLESDVAASGSLTTVILIRMRGASFEGASVGDSVAWLVSPANVVELTKAQSRKPLVGDGGVPAYFQGPLDGRLLLASDGLHKYAAYKDISRLCLEGTVERAAHALAELPRLRSGGYMDDVAVIVADALTPDVPR